MTAITQKICPSPHSGIYYAKYYSGLGKWPLGENIKKWIGKGRKLHKKALKMHIFVYTIKKIAVVCRPSPSPPCRRAGDRNTQYIPLVPQQCTVSANMFWILILKMCIRILSFEKKCEAGEKRETGDNEECQL